MKKQIGTFEAYLKSKAFTDHTIRKYAARAAQLICWAKENKLRHITYNQLLIYVQHLQNKGENPVLINARLLAIRHYFDYENQSGNLYLNKIIGHNPAQSLQIKGKEKKIQSDYLEEEELENLYESYEGNGKVILGLLVYQGLKAAELQRIESLHLDFRKGTLYIPASTRANSRLLKIESLQLYDLIQLAIERKNDYLLQKPLQNKLFALFKQLRKINPKVRNAHQLRGSRIVYWIQTQGLRQAQYKAGHTTIAATEKYKQADLKDLWQQVNTHHPLQ
jgi:integrase/recombinase XerD